MMRQSELLNRHDMINQVRWNYLMSTLAASSYVRSAVTSNTIVTDLNNDILNAASDHWDNCFTIVVDKIKTTNKRDILIKRMAEDWLSYNCTQREAFIHNDTRVFGEVDLHPVKYTVQDSVFAYVPQRYTVGNIIAKCIANWKIIRKEQNRFEFGFQNKADALAKLHPAVAVDEAVILAYASSINNTVVPVVAIWSDDCLRRWPVLPSWANAGVDPVVKTGPSHATCKAGWVTKALDFVEANETFPAQAFAITKGWDWDPAMNGGATLGDPIGASGARMLTTLLHKMARYNADNTVVPVVAIWSDDCLRRWPVLPSWANAGVDPVVKTGPSHATCKAGWVTKALDFVEANETFPAQAFAITKGWDWDPAMNGGATLGDPIGASGAKATRVAPNRETDKIELSVDSEKNVNAKPTWAYIFHSAGHGVFNSEQHSNNGDELNDNTSQESVDTNNISQSALRSLFFRVRKDEKYLNVDGKELKSWPITTQFEIMDKDKRISHLDRGDSDYLYGEEISASIAARKFFGYKGLR